MTAIETTNPAKAYQDATLSLLGYKASDVPAATLASINRHRRAGLSPDHTAAHIGDALDKARAHMLANRKAAAARRQDRASEYPVPMAKPEWMKRNPTDKLLARFLTEYIATADNATLADMINQCVVTIKRRI